MQPVIVDHVEKGLGRLLWQWRDSKKIQGLVESFMHEVQDVEDVLFDLLDNRSLTNAVGVQLDIIGELVGEPRQLRNDEDYRKALRYRALIARSSGTPTEVLNILQLLTEADKVALWEHYPGNIHVYADVGVNAFVVASLDRATAAAVSMRLMFDQGQNSFIGSDFVNEPFTLIDNNDNIFSVTDQFDIDYDLQVVGIGGAASGSERGVLPEMFVEGYMERYVASFSGTTESAEAVPLIRSRHYAISYKISGMTTGSFHVELQGGTVVTGQSATSNGVYNEVLVADLGNDTVSLVPSIDFDGTVEDFSIWLIPKGADLQNPLCEVVDKDINTGNFSFVITDQEDFIVDELDNNIIAIS